MKWYKDATLIDTLDDYITPSKLPLNKPLRGVVQDTYPYGKNQKIIACKIETGTLKQGENVIFNPSGKNGELKKILAFGATTEKAEPGESVGLVIDGIYNVERGEVLSHPENQPRHVKKFTAEIILLSGIQIKNGSKLTIRYGTAQKQCQIKKILSEIDPVSLTIRSKHPEILKEESVGKAEFLALEPTCVEKYSDFAELGRFVIQGKRGTSAAGIILEITETSK
jgi:elongation factor 1-alpha